MGSSSGTARPGAERSGAERAVRESGLSVGVCPEETPVTSLRAVEEKGALTMAAELEFSPPEIPEPTFMENVLRYGLFFGAIFQLICVLAIILPVPKSHKTDSDSFEPKNSETVKKPKATAPQISKKPKKETKKKR
ncbi:protein MANBAL isoform X1 [Hirundo rustica]|nr:protein MANBAL isoform X1 [Hirundo rustica]